MADPQFCKDTNAEEWDYYEVAYWVNKNGYEYAMKRFYDEQIDGNVLLYDVNYNMLVNQLGVTSIHSQKFMRSLNELRSLISKQKNNPGPLELEHNLNVMTIDSSTNEYEEKMESLKRESQNKLAEMEMKIRDEQQQYKLIENQNTEKVLNLQRELNKTEEKFLKSQQEIVQLNSQLNELKESLNAIKNVHIGQINDVKNEYNEQIKDMNDKLIDYNSMKTSYDSICKQLNDSKQTINSMKIEFENTKQTNQLNIDSIKRQFQRDNDNLNEEIKKLNKINDSLSDQNKELKSQLSKKSNSNSNSNSTSPVKMGPLYDTNEVNNPYLDLSSPRLTSPPIPPQSSFGSNSLSSYVQELEEKHTNDAQHFANTVWSNCFFL